MNPIRWLPWVSCSRGLALAIGRAPQRRGDGSPRAFEAVGVLVLLLLLSIERVQSFEEDTSNNPG